MANDIQTKPDFGRLRDLARKRFALDLPNLLAEQAGSWVAYHGDKQLGVARHSGELQELSRQRHLSLEEVMLFEIVGPDEEMVFGPMAFD